MAVGYFSNFVTKIFFPNISCEQKIDSTRTQTMAKVYDSNQQTPSSTTALVEASTFSHRLSFLEPRMKRMELFRRAKLIFVKT